MSSEIAKTVQGQQNQFRKVARNIKICPRAIKLRLRKSSEIAKSYPRATKTV